MKRLQVFHSELFIQRYSRTAVRTSLTRELSAGKGKPFSRTSG
jgi:hypothetical protein